MSNLGRNKEIRRERRSALIAATLRVIARHGVAGTTIARVAGEAQVAAGLINFHFASKQELFHAAFDELSDEFDRLWRESLEAAAKAPRAQLTAMVATYFEPRIFTADKLAVWFAFWADAELRDKFRANATRVERRYIDQMEAALAAHFRRRKDPRAAARVAIDPLIALIDGYWLQALIYRENFSRTQALAQAQRMLETVLV
jgi:TetR/AcrR family transcriptional regulator, transcriptional repressor of bet genes